ncbi:MAG: hypothetical protein WAO00_07585 [Chthoniobacterales bacterium]
MNAARVPFFLVATVLSLDSAIAAAKSEDSGLAQVLLQNGYRSVALQHSKEKGFVLAAKINGKPARLAVSMTAPMSAIFRRAKGALAITERKSGSYLNSSLGPSNEEYGLASGNSIELANMVMPATTFVVLDQSNTPAAPWHDIAGFLGEAELYRLAAVLDCANSRLYLRPAGREPRVIDRIGQVLRARGFVSVPMRINSAHHFEVQSRVNSYQSIITVEPINSLTSITDRTAKAGRVPLTVPSEELVGVGGVRRTSHRAQVAELVIGSFLIPNATVYVANANFDVLGLDQLGRCSAVIDLGARRLYLHGRPIGSVN